MKSRFGTITKNTLTLLTEQWIMARQTGTGRGRREDTQEDRMQMCLKQEKNFISKQNRKYKRRLKELVTLSFQLISRASEF